MYIFGTKLSTEVAVFIGILILIIVVHLFCGCCNMNALREGLASLNDGESSKFSILNNGAINTSSWFKQDLTVTPGQPLSPGVQSIMDRPPQQVPMPEGEMFMFANTEFKPECCPNAYSTSSGCACMTTAQYNDLVLRGGNNVPYSEY